MKRGKVEEKMMGPMFPRLHVNDTEKGGPRAPPRNKMALYEQLSIPSQRFSHVVLPCNPKNHGADLMLPLGQGGGNDRGMFFARQVLPRLPSEKQCSQYSESSTPLVHVEQRKKLDEDDYRVPIFIDSLPTEFDKRSSDINQESLSPPNLHPSLKFQNANETWMFGKNTSQEGKNKKGENANKFMVGQKQSVSSQSDERGDDHANSIHRLRTDYSGQTELSQPTSDRHSAALLGEDTAVAMKRKSSNTLRALPTEDQNFAQDLSNDTGSREDGSCGPLQKGNLERGDSVSETSVLDTVSSLDMTPDDVVGIIGQKHFWEARRAILNQQRIFAVQVFELHRLVEVQKMIAASPHLLLEDSACFTKPIKALSGKKRPLDCAVKPISTVSNEKGDSEYPSHKDSSPKTTVEKTSFSSAQNGVVPSSCCTPASPVIGSEHRSCSTQPQAHQWLIPVMSPSEGLVYKPYHGPGVVGQASGGYPPPGSNPIMANFFAPAYGVPAPPNPYPFPYGYFPPYGMPIMTTTAFSGSSVEQMSPSQAMSAVPTHQNMLNSRAAEEVEVQASSSSSRSERRLDSRVVEGRNGLRLSPTSPVIDSCNSSPQVPEPGRLTRVIKVVPRNGVSASESAARIFRSIQEERKRHESV